MKLIRLFAEVLGYGFFASAVIAQTLTPVTAPAGSGIPWWVGFVVAGVILIAGFVWLKLKKRAVADKVVNAATIEISADTTKLHQALLDAESHIAGFAERAKQHLDGVATAATAAGVPTATAEPQTTPTPNPLQPQLDAANGKLAQIKAILEG